MTHFDEDMWQGEGDWEGEAGQWDCMCCRFKNSSFMPVCEVCSLPKGQAPEGFNEVDGSLKSLLLSESRLEQHQAACRSDPHAYCSEVSRMLDLEVSLSSASRARITATLAAEHQHRLFDRLLNDLSIAELLVGLKFLDAPRKVRQLERKVISLTTRKAKRATKREVEAKITALKSEILDGASLTGSIGRKARIKMKQIPADKLEFYLLMFPREPWKDLADMLHLKRSDFSLDYFQGCIFGEAAPAGSLVADTEACTDPANLVALLEKHPNLLSMYSYLRNKFPELRRQGGTQGAAHGGQAEALGAQAVANRVTLARGAPLEDVLWFYEELSAAPGVEEAVHERLAKGESLEAGRGRTNYGKLMERLILFRNKGLSFVPQLMTYAEDKLAALATSVGSGKKVAVLGDASGSMEVAINTSTILGSLLSVCLEAELRFFNDFSFQPSTPLATAADVLKVTEQTVAAGVTAPAAALWPYYESKVPVDLFVVVSDEEENTAGPQDLLFADLFRKYKAEVHPQAEVFLVSFLQGPSSFLGKMNATLRTKGIRCRQFRLDGRRPDLSKLPNLLALLNLELGLRLAGTGTGVHAHGAAATAGAGAVDPNDPEELDPNDGHRHRDLGAALGRSKLELSLSAAPNTTNATNGTAALAGVLEEEAGPAIEEGEVAPVC